MSIFAPFTVMSSDIKCNIFSHKVQFCDDYYQSIELFVLMLYNNIQIIEQEVILMAEEPIIAKPTKPGGRSGQKPGQK